MDAFKYQLELSKIDSFKYVKDIREALYYYYNLAPSYWDNDIVINSSKLLCYKLFSKTFWLFHEKSSATLPDKFLDKLENTQSNIVKTNFENSAATYSQLLDIFEYDKKVHLGYIQPEIVLNLTKVVGTNTLPFKLYMDNFTRSFSSNPHFNGESFHTSSIILSWANLNNIPHNYTLIEEIRRHLSQNFVKNDLPKFQRKREELMHSIDALDSLIKEINEQ